MILENKPQALDEIHNQMHLKSHYLHHESTYNAIEKMVDSGLLKKVYNKDKKKIV